MTNNALEGLPQDVLLQIAQWLSLNEQGTLRSVSKKINQQRSDFSALAMLLQPYLNRLRAIDPTIKIIPGRGQTSKQLFIEGFEKIKKRQQEEIKYLTTHARPVGQFDPVALLATVPNKIDKLDELEACDEVIHALNVQIIKNQIDFTLSLANVVGPFPVNNTLLIGGTGITRVPSELFYQEQYKEFWENLTCFDCSRNNIQFLPKEIGNLSKLEKLSLYENQLQSLPKELGKCVALKSLVCFKNRLQTLPIELRNCKNLNGIECMNNPIKHVPISIEKKLDYSSIRQINSNFAYLSASIGLANLFRDIPLMLTTAAAIGLFTVTTYVRDIFKRQQYCAYEAKQAPEIAALTVTQKKAFEIGTSAAKSYQNQLVGLFQWQAYRSPKAYYAGLQAGIDQDNELVQKVRSKPGV